MTYKSKSLAEPLIQAAPLGRIGLRGAHENYAFDPVRTLSDHGISLERRKTERQPSAPKKNFNSNIYEKEKAINVSGKVKTTRTSRDETSVYFDGIKKSGPYILSGSVKDYTKLKNKLVKSSGPNGGPVTVTIDDQDNILTVEIKDSSDSEEPKE